MELAEAVPGDGRLEGLHDDAARGQHLAAVGHADECIAPLAGRALALCILALERALVVLAAMRTHDLQRALHVRILRPVRRLEGDHQDRMAAVAGAVHERLVGIHQAAVRRVEVGLGDRAHALGRLIEVLEARASCWRGTWAAGAGASMLR